MIARFLAWLRWIRRIDWIYTGTTIGRERCGDDRISYEVKHWLNVHTHEERHTIGRQIDEDY